MAGYNLLILWHLSMSIFSFLVIVHIFLPCLGWFVVFCLFVFTVAYLTLEEAKCEHDKKKNHGEVQNRIIRLLNSYSLVPSRETNFQANHSQALFSAQTTRGFFSFKVVFHLQFFKSSFPLRITA